MMISRRGGVRMSWARRIVWIVGSALLLARPASAAGDEPAVLRALEAGAWRAQRVTRLLPPLELRWEERLEIQHFVQLIYDGGALRLVGSLRGGNLFGVLVDIRHPRYAAFARLAGSTRYLVHHEHPYVAVLRVAPVSGEQFARLKSRRWTERELKHELGAPSSNGHGHGMGFFDMTYVPQGLAFVGDTPTAYAPVEFELLKEFDAIDFRGLPPLQYIADLDYTGMDVRKAFARSLVRDRREVEAALARGKRSPGGRFVVGRMNLGGTYNTEEVVIRERGKPERRYYPGYFTEDDSYLWLDAGTILYRLWQPTGDVEFHIMDAATGAKTFVATVGYEDPHRVTAFGVSGPHEFWYTTNDAVRHDVRVAARP